MVGLELVEVGLELCELLASFALRLAVFDKSFAPEIDCPNKAISVRERFCGLAVAAHKLESVVADEGFVGLDGQWLDSLEEPVPEVLSPRFEQRRADITAFFGRGLDLCVDDAVDVVGEAFADGGDLLGGLNTGSTRLVARVGLVHLALVEARKNLLLRRRQLLAGIEFGLELGASLVQGFALEVGGALYYRLFLCWSLTFRSRGACVLNENGSVYLVVRKSRDISL